MQQDKLQQKRDLVQLRLEVVTDQHQTLHKNQNKDQHQETQSDVQYQQSLDWGRSSTTSSTKTRKVKRQNIRGSFSRHEETSDATGQIQVVMDQKLEEGEVPNSTMNRRGHQDVVEQMCHHHHQFFEEVILGRNTSRSSHTSSQQAQYYGQWW